MGGGGLLASSLLDEINKEPVMFIVACKRDKDNNKQLPVLLFRYRTCLRL